MRRAPGPSSPAAGARAGPGTALHAGARPVGAVGSRPVPSAPMPTRDPKEQAGRRAADLVEDGMALGLGTGSTGHFALLRLPEPLRSDGLRGGGGAPPP